MKTFFENRFVSKDDGTHPASLYDTIHKNNAPTFQSLNTQKQSKEKNRKTTQKVDQTVLERLITAFQAGRSVNLDEVMQNELVDVPLALATVERKSRTGTKATLLNLLAEGIRLHSSTT